MGKITCAKCCSSILAKMAKQPRVNSTLVVANRMAKTSKLIVTGGSSKGCNFFNNHDQPDKAFTTVRAKRNGKANAASGKIFVTVPSDHFGPVLGVLVGETWEGGNGLCTFHQLQELLDSQNMVHSQSCSLEVNTFKAYRF
ncbi:hypothetical protein LWI29_017732 [Acer saccharum]|uniref:Uncharacterized protein n=1 Tax=Acer saccharum TaxID=4024 RepID=A0AA39S8Z7_ACESA|nr:hypothetical protein LWI29_017732 [Acer saccharum]